MSAHEQSDYVIAEKLQGWSENESVIMAHRSNLSANANCELCGSGIITLPQSRDKAKLPGWHLICRECVGHVRKQSELKFAGRFRTEAEAREKLPR